MKFITRKIDESYIVDVRKKECICRLWQLNENGYVHSVATLTYLNITPDGAYVDPLYLGAFFHNTYKQSISGMNEMSMWHFTNFLPPLPPLKRRMPGRPTMKRIWDASERFGKHMVSKARKIFLVAYAKRKGTIRPYALKCQSHLKLMSQRNRRPCKHNSQ